MPGDVETVAVRVNTNFLFNAGGLSLFLQRKRRLKHCQHSKTAPPGLVIRFGIWWHQVIEQHVNAATFFAWLYTLPPQETLQLSDQRFLFFLKHPALSPDGVSLSDGRQEVLFSPEGPLLLIDTVQLRVVLVSVRLNSINCKIFFGGGALFMWLFV